MKKSVIGIDLDGTIVDSFGRHKKLLFDIIKNIDSNFKENELDDFQSFKRNGYSTEQYLRHKQHSDIECINNKWVENIETPIYLEMDKLYSFTYEFLEATFDSYLLYLVTARKNEQGVIELLKKFNMVKYFTEIIIVKPGQGAANRKAEETIDKNIRYVIGDTETDYKWAKLIKAEFFAVNYGFRSKEWWESSYNIVSYSSLNDIRLD